MGNVLGNRIICSTVFPLVSKLILMYRTKECIISGNKLLVMPEMLSSDAKTFEWNFRIRDKTLSTNSCAVLSIPSYPCTFVSSVRAKVDAGNFVSS